MDSSFPGNSFNGRDQKVAPEGTPEKKNLDPVVKATSVRTRKPSLGRKFKETFMGGDARTAWGFVFFDVLVPAAKDTISEAFSQGVEKMLFGEVRNARRRGGSSGSQNYTNYRQYSSSNSRPPWESAGRNDRSERREISREARASHDFGDIILDTRPEADAVIERLYNVLNQYDVVTVAELYSILDMNSTHQDGKWGWYDLRGSGPTRARGGGFSLNLPRPELID
jgi:hypothetical protein